jgi:hypothetical protein
VRCGNSGCQALSSSFDGDVEGWGGGGGDDSAATSDLAVSSERVHAGRGALRSTVSVTATRYRWRMSTGLCLGSGVNIQGRQLQAWLYIASSSSLKHGCALGGFGAGSEPFGAYGGSTTQNVPPNQWTLITEPASQAAASSAGDWGIDCWLDDSISWSGTIYADDFAVR